MATVDDHWFSMSMAGGLSRICGDDKMAGHEFLGGAAHLGGPDRGAAGWADHDRRGHDLAARPGNEVDVPGIGPMLVVEVRDSSRQLRGAVALLRP